MFWKLSDRQTPLKLEPFTMCLINLKLMEIIQRDPSGILSYDQTSYIMPRIEKTDAYNVDRAPIHICFLN